MELVTLVRRNAFFLSSAQSAEVFSSDRDLIHEELENDATLLRNLRSFSSALNVEEDLGVLCVELRELANNFIVTSLGSELLLVESLLESFGVSSSLTLGGHSLLFSNLFVNFTDGSVFGVNLIGFASIL
jgi:hypothetical protein